jgi:hypothetical protein
MIQYHTGQYWKHNCRGHLENKLGRVRGCTAFLWLSRKGACQLSFLAHRPQIPALINPGQPFLLLSTYGIIANSIANNDL